MKRAFAFAAAAALASGSCVVGAPPGFSKGDAWKFPLVGSLENSALVTPVWVNDKGPYLFLIDPDSPGSSLDEGIVAEVKPYTKMDANRYDDEQDTTHPMRLAEISKIRIGAELTVEHHDFWVVPQDVFNVDGRKIRGVIGHDMISDSMAFGFDRDAGFAYLATKKGFAPPPGAQELDFRTLTSHLAVNLQPVGRHLVTAKVNGKDQLLHIDLGASPSQLREAKWGDLGLQTVPAKTFLVDEVGTLRTADHAAVAQSVVLGPITGSGVKLAPYDDRRWEREDIDGTLGLSFFAKTNLWVDLDKNKLYLSARSSDVSTGAKERITRWGSAQLSGCPHLGCLDVSMLEPEAPTPPPAGGSDLGAAARPVPASASGIVHMERDPQARDMDIELTLEAVDKAGVPLPLPLLVASFPAGADTMTTQLDAAYGDATLKVVDASPFPRQCPTQGKACLYTLGTAE